MPYVNKSIEQKIIDIHDIVCARDENNNPRIYQSHNTQIIAALDDIARTQSMIVTVLERMLERLENN